MMYKKASHMLLQLNWWRRTLVWSDHAMRETQMPGLKYADTNGLSHSEKNFREGEFSEEAQAARDAFLKQKSADPQAASLNEMTALERRMQSGSI